MLKISDFSKLSHLTVKALRFYEKEGLLKPASVDEWNGYRFYETSQLEIAAKVLSIYHKGAFFLFFCLAVIMPTAIMNR